MLNIIISAIVGGVGVVIGVVITQAVLDGATTSSWSAGTRAIVFLLPLVLGAIGILASIKLLGRG